jgi:hypothetical protein
MTGSTPLEFRQFHTSVVEWKSTQSVPSIDPNAKYPSPLVFNLGATRPGRHNKHRKENVLLTKVLNNSTSSTLDSQDTSDLENDICTMSKCVS